MKYDPGAIATAKRDMPHFLSRSRDKKLIMRRDEKGDFDLLANDQETIVHLSAADARDFALWILLSAN